MFELVANRKVNSLKVIMEIRIRLQSLITNGAEYGSNEQEHKKQQDNNKLYVAKYTAYSNEMPL